MAGIAIASQGGHCDPTPSDDAGRTLASELFTRDDPQLHQRRRRLCGILRPVTIPAWSSSYPAVPGSPVSRSQAAGGHHHHQNLRSAVPVCEDAQATLPARAHSVSEKVSGQSGTTLPHLRRHDAHRGETHFGSTVFSAARHTTDQEVRCRHVLMRAARLRSPLQNPSGSALIRGRVLSNQLLRTKATVFPPAQEKSWLALLKNTLHRLGSRAPLQPRTESPGFKSHNLVDHRVRPAAAHFKRSNRNCPVLGTIHSSAHRQFRLKTNVFQEQSPN